MSKKYGPQTTAHDLVEDACMRGKTVIVTGGNSGMGLETVDALASAGAQVIMGCRSIVAGQNAARSLKGLKGRVIVRRLDLADFKSIKDFVQSLDTFEKIHVLVCNAGVAGAPFGFTKQGFEMHMGVNHFSHFYLTQLLLPKLRAAGTKNDPARIIVVSSVNAGFVKLDNRYWDDPKWEKRAYIYGMAYSESKLANIYMANELARRASIEDAPIVAYSLHPGLVRTSLLRYGRWNDGCMGCIASMCGKSAQQGAATAVWAVVTPEIPTGSFLENCAVAKPLTKNTKQARECWERTEDIIANALAEMSEKSKGINE